MSGCMVHSMKGKLYGTKHACISVWSRVYYDHSIYFARNEKNNHRPLGARQPKNALLATLTPPWPPVRTLPHSPTRLCFLSYWLTSFPLARSRCVLVPWHLLGLSPIRIPRAAYRAPIVDGHIGISKRLREGGAPAETSENYPWALLDCNVVGLYSLSRRMFFGCVQRGECARAILPLYVTPIRSRPFHACAR